MRPFEPSDLGIVNCWYTVRGQGPIGPDLVPGLALIEPGIAAGFAYRTDAAGVAFLDGLISNPAAPIRQRVKALRAITEGLIALVRLYGYKRAFGLSKSARRAERLGFQVIGDYALTVKEII